MCQCQKRIVSGLECIKHYGCFSHKTEVVLETQKTTNAKVHCRTVAEVYINIHEHKYKDDFVDSISYETEKRDRIPRETSKLE